MILYVDNLSTLGDWKNDLLILQLVVTTPLKGSLKNPKKDHPKLPGKKVLYHFITCTSITKKITNRMTLKHRVAHKPSYKWSEINPYKCPYKWATGVLTPQRVTLFFFKPLRWRFCTANLLYKSSIFKIQWWLQQKFGNNLATETEEIKSWKWLQSNLGSNWIAKQSWILEFWRRV